MKTPGQLEEPHSLSVTVCYRVGRAIPFRQDLCSVTPCCGLMDESSHVSRETLCKVQRPIVSFQITQLALGDPTPLVLLIKWSAACVR